jgi:hypothetical protein
MTSVSTFLLVYEPPDDNHLIVYPMGNQALLTGNAQMKGKGKESTEFLRTLHLT